METTRFAFMPKREIQPLHTKIKLSAARLKISMSRLCAEALGKPDYAKWLKDGRKPTESEVAEIEAYIAKEKENRRRRAEEGRALGNTKNAENHDDCSLSFEMGSYSLFRALLRYGINHDGLPGMSAKDLIDACRREKITITYDSRVIAGIAA